MSKGSGPQWWKAAVLMCVWRGVGREVVVVLNRGVKLSTGFLAVWIWPGAWQQCQWSVPDSHLPGWECASDSEASGNWGLHLTALAHLFAVKDHIQLNHRAPDSMAGHHWTCPNFW